MKYKTFLNSDQENCKIKDTYVALQETENQKKCTIKITALLSLIPFSIAFLLYIDRRRVHNDQSCCAIRLSNWPDKACDVRGSMYI